MPCGKFIPESTDEPDAFLAQFELIIDIGTCRFDSVLTESYEDVDSAVFFFVTIRSTGGYAQIEAVRGRSI